MWIFEIYIWRVKSVKLRVSRNFNHFETSLVDIEPFLMGRRYVVRIEERISFLVAVQHTTVSMKRCPVFDAAGIYCGAEIARDS